MDVIRREQVIAFRLARHHLDRRAPEGALLEVAALGIQNSPPGSALLALGARMEGLAPADLQNALEADKSLLQYWSLRAAPYITPTADAPLFTAGLLPDDEESCLFFMRGAAEHLRRFGLGARQAVELAAAALPGVLAGGAALSKDELGVALAEAVRRELPPTVREPWDAPDGLGRNSYGQSLVRYALAVVSLAGLLCLAPPRRGQAAQLMLTEAWLGRPLAIASGYEVDSEARAGLVRRFLRYFGPGDATGFARWAGVSPAYALASWELVAGELAPAKLGRRALWLLAADAGEAAAAELPHGVRLLPPHDPYCAAHDKALLVPDPALARRLWRSRGSPGAVCLDGEIAGVWRARQAGRRLTLRVEPFARLEEAARRRIEEEAQRLAPLRQAEGAAVEFLG